MIDDTLDVQAGYLKLLNTKNLPETVLASLVGHKVGELVSHPRLVGTVLETRRITAVHPGKCVGVSYDVGTWNTAEEAIAGMLEQR